MISQHTDKDKLAKILRHNAEVDDIRQATAKKRAPFTSMALRLDDCLKDENGDERENSLLSDGGRAAQLIRSMGEKEEWVDELENVLDNLSATEQKVVEALDEDPRPAVAARIANTSRQQVYRIMKRLQKRLARCYTLRHFYDSQMPREKRSPSGDRLAR